MTIIKGIAYLLKAYTFQVATDAFGDIPLSEALKANGNLNPKYEAQEVVMILFSTILIRDWLVWQPNRLYLSPVKI